MFRIYQLTISLRLFTACITAALCVGPLAKNALADLTIATQMNVTGIAVDPDASDPLPTFPIKSTIYFQGDKSRLELSTGTVLIFDNDSDSLYQLDPGTKTYQRESIRSFEDIEASLPANMAKWVSITEDLTLDKSSDAAVYFNNLSLRTDVTGEAIFEPVTHVGPGRDRGGGGGGGGPGLYQGGRGGDGGGRGHRQHEHGPMGMHLPMLDISGSIWETHAVTLPKERHEIILPVVLQMAWGGAPFVEDFVEQLDKNHQLPLHSELTVTTSYPAKPGDTAPAPVPVKTTTTFDVVSVTDGALPDTLFEIPTGYTKKDGPVKLPQLQAPYMGRVHTYGDDSSPGS